MQGTKVLLLRPYIKIGGSVSPIIIKHIGCHVCGVKAGEKCVGSFGDAGHGDRLDIFIQEAPYEARLEAHLDQVQEIERTKDRYGEELYKQLLDCSLFLSDDELLLLWDE